MSDSKTLCNQLLHADSEDDVIVLLERSGYWDKPVLWRPYGDVENNWGQIGNQQSLAEAALAEKIVNSVDARLIDECWKRGIDPEGKGAPRTIRAAVARFFENGTGEKIATGGKFNDWSGEEIRKVADRITLTVTGTRPKDLNITISDCGEGQTPDKLPETILSLSKSNKLRIPFVQGQFNQGGTGALRFCGENNLQLVISRRNPDLLGENPSPRDREWCFTIVRRERPSNEQPGARKNSVYTYLAPFGAGGSVQERCGGVLSFDAETFGIYPDDKHPYGRQASYGTAIKMFDYKFTGERSHILCGNSLLSRLDLLLSEIAPPVRLYEYRTDKSGKYIDVDRRCAMLLGLLRRLEGDKNVEEGFPVHIPFQTDGEKLSANVFAFVQSGSTKDFDDDENASAISRKCGGARNYRKNEGEA